MRGKVTFPFIMSGKSQGDGLDLHPGSTQKQADSKQTINLSVKPKTMKCLENKNKVSSFFFLLNRLFPYTPHPDYSLPLCPLLRATIPPLSPRSTPPVSLQKGKGFQETAIKHDKTRHTNKKKEKTTTTKRICLCVKHALCELGTENTKSQLPLDKRAWTPLALQRSRSCFLGSLTKPSL